MRYELFCGDCLEILPTLESGSVQAVITDPPYGIDYQSNRRQGDKLDKIAGDLAPFLGWGQELYRITTDTACCLIFYKWLVQEPFVQELTDSGWIVKSQIIWDKMVHGTGDLTGEFAPQHECILFARKPGFAFPGTRPKTILHHMRVAHQYLLHPNEKPVALLEELITSVTRKDDAVLDFTFGSGVCGVAAMRTGRRFIGIELDQGHYDTGQQRIKNAAGEFARTRKEIESGQLSLL